MQIFHVLTHTQTQCVAVPYSSKYFNSMREEKKKLYNTYVFAVYYFFRNSVWLLELFKLRRFEIIHLIWWFIFFFFFILLRFARGCSYFFFLYSIEFVHSGHLRYLYEFFFYSRFVQFGLYEKRRIDCVLECKRECERSMCMGKGTKNAIRNKKCIMVCYTAHGTILRGGSCYCYCYGCCWSILSTISSSVDVYAFVWYRRNLFFFFFIVFFFLTLDSVDSFGTRFFVSLSLSITFFFCQSLYTIHFVRMNGKERV